MSLEDAFRELLGAEDSVEIIWGTSMPMTKKNKEEAEKEVREYLAQKTTKQ